MKILEEDTTCINQLQAFKGCKKTRADIQGDV